MGDLSIEEKEKLSRRVRCVVCRAEVGERCLMRTNKEQRRTGYHRLRAVEAFELFSQKVNKLASL